MGGVLEAAGEFGGAIGTGLSGGDPPATDATLAQAGSTCTLTFKGSGAGAAYLGYQAATS